VSDNECSTDGGALCLPEVTGANDVGSCVAKCAPVIGTDGGPSDAQSTCRNSYRCLPLFFNDGGFANEGACVGQPIPPPTTIGNTCAIDTDCQQPAGTVAQCIPPTLPDGGASAFTGGSCTRFDCNDDTDCSPNSSAICVVFTIQNQQFTRCERRCASSTAGQSDCRAGYACEGLGQADGGQTAFGICQPACTVPGVGCPMGQTCNTTTGYCG
jgi:hypothetical protein